MKWVMHDLHSSPIRSLNVIESDTASYKLVSIGLIERLAFVDLIES